mgnify:CR=1 FL=1
MMKWYDKQILEFVENEVDFHRLEMIHGTLYAKLKNDSDCNSLHKKLERFYRKNINPSGAVNMFFVGDEFAFDLCLRMPSRQVPTANSQKKNFYKIKVSRLRLRLIPYFN